MSTADPDVVARRVKEAFAKEDRQSVRVRGDELGKMVAAEEWRDASRVDELSAIEFRTLAARRLKAFAEKEMLEEEITGKLLTLADNLWDELAAADGRRPTNWPNRRARFIREFMERAKSVLTPTQMEHLQDMVAGREGAGEQG